MAEIFVTILCLAGFVGVFAWLYRDIMKEAQRVLQAEQERCESREEE